MGDSGKSVAITGITVTSGATLAVPYVRNGSGVAGDDIVFRADGTANRADTTAFNLPVMLPGGCYISFDANTTEVSVYYFMGSTS